VNVRHVFYACLPEVVIMGSSFTVFFDGSFWVAVVEVAEPDGSVRAARHVFGPEPTAATLWEFVRKDGNSLLDEAFAAPAVAGPDGSAGPAGRGNPKRLAREAARDQRRAGASTAARVALQASFDEAAKRRAGRGRRRRAEDDERRREAQVAKRKARHRGR
jgi:hypothetical protein